MYGVFQIAYDQEVYAKTASGYKPLSGWYEAQTVACPNLAERKFVNATTFFQGHYNITCTSSSGAKIIFPMNPFNAQALCTTALPQYPFYAKTATDIGGTFVNLMKGGYEFAEPVSPKTFAFVIPLSTQAAKSFFANGSGNCTMVKRLNARNPLTNKDGIVIFIY